MAEKRGRVALQSFQAGRVLHSTRIRCGDHWTMGGKSRISQRGWKFATRCLTLPPLDCLDNS